MREAAARGAAFGTGLLIVGAAALFAALEQRAPEPPAPADRVVALGVDAMQPPDTILALGRTVYQEEGCATCHSIAGVGSPRSPLDGVGSRLTPEEIRLWIVDPQAARPGVRKPAYDDLPPPRIDALVAYIESLEVADP